MDKRVFAIVYGAIGVGIIGLWIMLLATGQVPELQTEPTAIAFHITIEVAMGLMALLSGLLLWKESKKKGIVLFTNGMIAYSVVNSSGYYAESGDYSMIGMFGVLLLFVVYSTYTMIVQKKEV